MRPPTLRPQSKTHNLNRIIFLGLFSGILITTLIWLRIPNNIITPLSWLCFGLIGLGSFLYIRKTATNHSRWIMVLAALAAVSLVYLFPEMFRPVCGGMPRAFALNCPTECRIKECTKWVAGPSTECPNPGSGGGCCLSYTTTCDPDCNIEPVHDQPPTISGSVTCSQWSENGWCIDNAILELTAIEPQGKLLQISGDIGGIPFSCPAGSGSVNCSVPLTEGTVTVNYLATSITTLTATGSKTYKFDTTSPQINGILNGIPGANAWYISQVELSASASDPGSGSGMSTFEYNLNSTGWANYAGPLSLSDGVHNLSLRASDLAGNSVETNQTIQVDTITPALNLSINGKSGSNGWYTSNILVDAATSDTGSGVSSLEYNLDGIGWIPYSETLGLSDGTHSLSLRVTDNAGNVTEGTQNFSVDTITPTIDFSVVGTQGTNSWYISDVQVSSSVSDSGSGLSLLEVSTDGGAYSIYSEPLGFSDGLHSYQFRATDNAGNLAESPIQQVKVDTILPVIDLPASWNLGQAIIFKLQDDGSGLGSVRLVVEDEDERFPKVAWEKKLNSYKFKGEIDWNGRFKDGQLAPQGGEYYAWVKVSDAAGNERMQAGQIIVPFTSIVEELFPPSGDQTDGLVSGAEVSGTIKEQSVPQTSVNDKAVPSEYSATNTSPPISFGGDNNGAAQPSDAQAGMTSFNAGGRSNSPIANSQSNLLWGATATAAIGAFAAEIARRKAARRAANAAVNQARKLKQQAYIYSQQLKKQKEAKDAINALRRQATYALNFERNEEILGKELSANLRKIQERQEELERAKQATHESFRAQEAIAYQEITPKKAEWWENTKTFVWDKIVSPVNSSIYQPYVKPAIGKISESAKDGASWVNERVYQPYLKPVLENEINKASDNFTWANEHIVQAHVKPFIEKTTQVVTNAATWVSEKIYKPYVEPLMEKAVNKISEGIAWANENLYQPRLQPLIDSFIGNVYQPYISPLVDKGKAAWADFKSQVNEIFYQPFLQPIVADIDQYIYQPYLKPTQDKVTDWWEKTWDEYGEWVHGALDTVGFIPGLGDIADGINGLIYLGEGRYLEASISALSIIPLIGDLSKGGKWGLKLGKEIVEEGVEKVIKETTEELVEEALEVVSEKAAKEVGEELAEKVVKETLEEVTEKTIRETGEDIVEHAAKEIIEEATEKAVQEVSEEALEKTVKEIVEETVEKNIREASEEVFETTTKNALENSSENITKRFTEEALEQSSEAIKLVNNFGEPGAKILEAVDVQSAHKLLSALDDDVIEYVIEQGPEAVDALSKWSKADLLKYGPELALRAKQDAIALEATSKLVDILKSMNPDQAELLIDIMKTQGNKGLVQSVETEARQLLMDSDNFKKAKELIETIASNSTHYPDGKQLGLGKWVDYGNGFTRFSRNTGSVHYNPHPEMWNLFEPLGKNREAAAWLINKQVVESGVVKGLPVEFALEGVPVDQLLNEKRVVELIFSGATDSKIMSNIKVEKLTVRWQELMELQKVGYEYAFDEVNNSFIFSLPKGVR